MCLNLQDEDSQAILSSLHCTNSRLGVAALTCGGIAARGDCPAESLADSSSRESKRRTRDRYAGELNTEEVENGFGMGMSSKVSTADGPGKGKGGIFSFRAERMRECVAKWYI